MRLGYCWCCTHYTVMVVSFSPTYRYGSAGAPRPDIPPNSKLLFDVELVGIK